MVLTRKRLCGEGAVLILLVAVVAPGGCAATAKPAWIDGFSGWASSVRGGEIYARIHKGTPPTKPKPNEASYARVKETIEALEVDELPGATVVVSGVPGITAATADDHGFIVLKVPPHIRPGLAQVTLTLAAPGYGKPSATIAVPVWDDSPGFGVISDIDDTLTATGVTHKWTMIKNTILRSTWELKTFQGAPETVAALTGDRHGDLARIPVFYLSGSPWGLHSRIAEFFDRAGFPRGSMILRRYSKEPLDPFEFKHPHLQKIFAAFPNRRWVLLGDSGEKDPEVYAQMRSESPAQVAAEYIHIVTDEPATSPRFANAVARTDWQDILNLVRAIERPNKQ